MKKNGFTLVELLGVIIVLGVIAMIIVPTINGSLKEHRNNLCKVQYENILLAAKAYGADHLGELNDGDIITLPTLQENGYIAENINNPKKKNEVITQADVVVLKTGNKINYKFKDEIACLGNNSYNVADRYVSDGLVLMYDVSSTPTSSGSDFIWKDLSGNGNDVTLKNFSSNINDWYSQEGLLFDGVDDYGITDEHNYDYVTVSVVVTPITVTTDELNILSSFNSGGYGIIMYNNLFRFQPYVNSNYVLVPSKNTVAANQEYIITGVYDGTSATLYIQGEKVNSVSAAGTIVGGTYFALGGNPDADQTIEYGWVNMNLKSVKLYNRALTEEEIMHNYQIDASRFDL